jgi:protein-disulfide isomerase
MAPKRRIALVAVALVAALGLKVAEAGAPDSALTSTEDMSIGNPKAKVTVIEYGSASCPHCAAFSNEVFPEFKKKYVDTGKVRYVFREFLTPPEEFATAGFMAARCAGSAKYFPFLEALYADQSKIYESGDLIGGLRKVARGQGLTDQQLDACIFDQKALQALNQRVNRAVADGVEATPTFVVGSKKIEGAQSLQQLAAVIDPQLAK